MYKTRLARQSAAFAAADRTAQAAGKPARKTPHTRNVDLEPSVINYWPICFPVSFTCGTTRMSENKIAASKLYLRMGCMVTSATSSGSYTCATRNME